MKASKDICNIFVIAGAKEKEGKNPSSYCVIYLLSLVSVVSLNL